MTLSEYYQWLKKNWAKTGFILSIFLLIFLVIFVSKTNFVLFLILVQTPLYMLHQTEEYVFPGGFGKFFNTKIFHLESEDEPVNETFIFFVNVGLIWVILPIFALLSNIKYDFGLWIPYFTLFAGVSHLILAIKAKKLYNPGLIVSLLINIPVGILSVLFLAKNGLIHNIFWNPHLFIGIGVNAILPIMGVILLRNYRKKMWVN